MQNESRFFPTNYVTVTSSTFKQLFLTITAIKYFQSIPHYCCRNKSPYHTSILTNSDNLKIQLTGKNVHVHIKETFTAFYGHQLEFF